MKREMRDIIEKSQETIELNFILLLFVTLLGNEKYLFLKDS